MSTADQETLLAALTADHNTATLRPADRAMLDYALKLTLTPGQMSAADIEPLRRTGFDDRAIHDICAVTAYFAFVNRIADGLGVDLEADHGDSQPPQTNPLTAGASD